MSTPTDARPIEPRRVIGGDDPNAPYTSGHEVPPNPADEA